MHARTKDPRGRDSVSYATDLDRGDTSNVSSRARVTVPPPPSPPPPPSVCLTTHLTIGARGGGSARVGPLGLKINQRPLRAPASLPPAASALRRIISRPELRGAYLAGISRARGM